MQEQQRLGALKHTVLVRKWEHRTPDDGEPDEVVEHSVWTEPDGTLIEDADRIAALEASLGQEP